MSECGYTHLLQYQYSAAPVSEIVQTLVKLAINTIDAQIHRCSTNDDTFDPSTAYYPKNRSRGKTLPVIQYDFHLQCKCTPTCTYTHTHMYVCETRFDIVT